MLAVDLALAVGTADDVIRFSVRICGFSIHGSNQQQRENNSDKLHSDCVDPLLLFHK